MTIEESIKADLYKYLKMEKMVDERLPQAPDLEDLWAKVGESYLPDGIREFTQYPTVSLGWMMFIGMAMAKLWDEDWERYSQEPDLYKFLLQSTDFDHLDDYICDKVLNLGVKGHKAVSAVVAECASRTNNYLMHQGIEPGTAEAFRAYVAALHQMYMMGVAMELKRLGYKMQLA